MLLKLPRNTVSTSVMVFFVICLSWFAEPISLPYYAHGSILLKSKVTGRSWPDLIFAFLLHNSLAFKVTVQCICELH